MNVKGKIFYNFVKQSYKKISEVEGKEEVYRKDDKLVVVIKDEEVGRKIYDIIKALKDKKYLVSTTNLTLEITKYFVGEENVVQIFMANFKYCRENGEILTSTEKLEELVEFAYEMEKIDYILDESKFESETCDRISDFLTFFSANTDKGKSSNGVLIKYIHYAYSNGGNLEEFYERILKNNKIYDISEFPYNLPIIKLCYKYYTEKSLTEEEILQTLSEEKEYEKIISENANYYAKDVFLANKELDSNIALIEDNANYAIYDGNIKIYHNIPTELEDFLKNRIDFIKAHKELLQEQVEKLILDFKGKIVGYKFAIQEAQEMHKISDIEFKNQNEIVSFIEELDNYLNKAIKTQAFKLKKKNDFVIEDAIISRKEGDSFYFRFLDSENLYNFFDTDPYVENIQIVAIFFKLLLKYCNKKYGIMSKKSQLLEKDEIKYLAPLLVKEFIKYALGDKEHVDYKIAADTLFEFIYRPYRRVADTENAFSYDSRFVYNPKDVQVIFDFEAEKENRIELKREIDQYYLSGEKLVTYKNIDAASELHKEVEKRKIRLITHTWPTTNAKIVGISKIICSSKNLNDEDMYEVLGCVTEPIEGKQLTDDMLLNLDSKQLAKVMAYLSEIFKSNTYISLDKIWMNDEFQFSINIWDRKFEIGTDTEFVEYMVNHLIDIGYNPYVFKYVDYRNSSELLSYANDTDAYCSEHGIYYKSSQMCPACRETKFFMPQDFTSSAETLLYEDSYAKHYKFDEDYNFKIYNKSNVNMAELEKCIEEIVRKNLASKEFKAQQDSFIPFKKLIGHNNEFIGCVYKATVFDDVLFSISDIAVFKNRARLKMLIRLMKNVKEITDNGLGFVENPFGDVFLNVAENKQVQILNIELLSEKGDIKNTLKWTCAYACNILSMDKTIEIDLTDCATDFDLLLSRAEELSEQMTAYCAVHRMYYKESYMFCPECVKEDDAKQLKIKYVSKDSITQNEKIGYGGESKIYPYKKGTVAKVFRENDNENVNVNYNLKMAIISRIIKKRAILEEANNNKELKYKFIFPQILLADKKVFGYVMKKVENANELTILKDKTQIKRLGFSMKDVLEILITVGKGIEYLHTKANIYIGDLNGSNILFDNYKNVYFIDLDGMGVDEIQIEWCTPGYIDPISDKNANITMKDDWYSFAVQAFYYLTFSHPFNGIYCVEEDGKQVNLKIEDKMERRISLLGNHGIKPPAITKPWDWMNEELVTAFLNIFEKENRESIVPQLICQYKELYGDEENQKYGEIVRVNDKFVAKAFNPFEGKVVRLINQHVAICQDDKGDEYLAILFNADVQRKIYLENLKGVKKVILSENKKIVFVASSYNVIAISVEKEEIICDKEINNEQDVVIDGNTLYIVQNYKDESNILQIDFSTKDGIEEKDITFLPEQMTKRMLAKFNSKFVIVKQGDDTDEIYCNKEKLCDIYNTSESLEYNILYDEVTQSWLVLNNGGIGVIIDPTGMYKKIDISECVKQNNILNAQFYQKHIYVPTQNYLYIITANDQIVIKKMECNNVMTPDSKLCDINTSGFSVITDYVLYDVRKG